MLHKLKAHPQTTSIVVLVFLSISVLFFALAGFEFSKRYARPTTNLEQSVIIKPNNSTELKPLMLKVETAGIEIPLLTSHKVWEEKAKTAVYFSKTPLPGNKGNSVIYGHNFPNILGNLNKVEKGQQISIEFTDGSVKNFEVIQKINVTANQTHILKQTNDARLTIYTCSGILDTKRLVVVAKAI